MGVARLNESEGFHNKNIYLSLYKLYYNCVALRTFMFGVWRKFW